MLPQSSWRPCCDTKVERFLSDEHFSVDGTLVEAWASLKSFRSKIGADDPPSSGRNGTRDYHGEKRANDTHASIWRDNLDENGATIWMRRSGRAG